jgi:CO/xanthine dehydrogenase Mo-binding subunit
MPQETRDMPKTESVGKSVPRKEGRSKVTGAARYVDDLTMPDMLYGGAARSHPLDHFRGRHPLG